MRISPISSNNLYTQKKQTNPNFGARIDKYLVEQMFTSTSKLENLNVKTLAGIISLPAALVAKMNMTLTKKEEKENKFDSGSLNSNDFLYEVYMKQDAEGKTLLHKESSPEVLDLLNAMLTNEQFEKVLTVEDREGYPPVKISQMGKVLNMVNKRDFSLEAAYNIVNTNDLDDDVIIFLKERLNKQKQLGKPISAYINEHLFNTIIQETSAPKVYISKNSYFEDLNIATAAKLFKSGHYGSVYAEIDSEYLPFASDEEMEDIVAGALKGSKDAFKVLCSAIAALPSDKRKQVVDKMVSGIDINNFTKENMETIYITLKEACEKLYRKIGDHNSSIMENSICHVNSGSLEDSDFLYHFKKLDDINPEFLKETLLAATDTMNSLLILEQDNILEFVVDHYKDDSEMIKKIYSSKSFDGENFLHWADTENIERAFGVLNDDDLAEILSEKNKYGLTPLREQATHNHQEEFDLILYKIKELATNSDLSVEKSIALLEANNVAPQVVEFLKQK